MDARDEAVTVSDGGLAAELCFARCGRELTAWCQVTGGGFAHSRRGLAGRELVGCGKCDNVVDMRIVTLTTDFGLRDGFVGVMKGVLLSRAPRVEVVDLSHEVPPGNVQAAAFVLMNAHRYFPRGTVHVVVVDPGVGSERAALVVRTDHGLYLGPDNGVLSWALREENKLEVRRIENAELFLRPVSQTFHGRDVFAPVAAYLVGGGSVERVGPATREWVVLPWPEPRYRGGACEGEIVYVDRFGNALSNLPHLVVQNPHRGWFTVTGRKGVRFPACSCYAEVPEGRPVAVPGSSGFWELAVFGGSAAAQFGLRCGDKVVFRPGRAVRSRPDP